MSTGACFALRCCRLASSARRRPLASSHMPFGKRSRNAESQNPPTRRDCLDFAFRYTMSLLSSALPSSRGAMLVVMQSHATALQIEQVVEAIRQMKLTPHPMPGATRTAIGITGNIGTVDPRTLEVLPGVMELIRVNKPYKLASREMHPADTYVRLPQTVIGPDTFTMIAGPCSVENEELILRTAEFLLKQGIHLMRAGAFKPRTSPYAFQGMGLEGLDILARVRPQPGIGLVTELLD